MTTKIIRKCECGSRHILFADTKGAYCEKCMPVETADYKENTEKPSEKKPLKPAMKL